jgi:hypothetical protein
MSTSAKGPIHTSRPLAGAALALSLATLLGGCVVATPPPRAYAPPPRVYEAPPVYAEPAVDIEVHATEAPPPLPDYQQPPCPEEGYLWTPGYWAWSGGYYWVPGTWVQPPRIGVLWTPAYWGFVGGVYAFHPGYWGPHVGFYGGVNYGYGYVGVGFVGGRWEGNSFAYNRTVNNVNVTNIHNTYNETVINTVTVNRVSYNGGAGGIAAAPTARERAAARESHVVATPSQRQHIQEAARNPALAARANGGHPAIAATPRPAAFNAPGVVGAHGAAAAPPRVPGAQAPGTQAGGAPHFNNGAGAAPARAPQPNGMHASPNATMQPQAAGTRPPGVNPQPLRQQQPRPQAQAQPRPLPQAQPRPQQQPRPQAQPQPRPQQQHPKQPPER